MKAKDIVSQVYEVKEHDFEIDEVEVYLGFRSVFLTCNHCQGEVQITGQTDQEIEKSAVEEIRRHQNNCEPTLALEAQALKEQQELNTRY